VHYLPHQLLDDLLADDAILAIVFAIASMTSAASSVSTLPEPACLTMLASDRSTVTPLSPPPHQGAHRRTRHHPPANFYSC
jgi:hypothetical protein